MLAIAPICQRNLRHKIVGKAEIEDVFSGSVWIPGVVGRSKGVGKHAGGTGVRGQSVGQQIGDRRAAAVAGDQIYRVADVVFFSFILIFLGNFVYKSRCISFTKEGGYCIMKACCSIPLNISALRTCSLGVCKISPLFLTAQRFVCKTLRVSYGRFSTPVKSFGPHGQPYF